MRVTIGWLGFDRPVDNIAQVDENGDGLSISGRLAIHGSPELDDLKSQVLGLADQPWVAHPVVFDDATHLSGWYYVESASVNLGPGALFIGYWPYDIKLRRCARTRTPVIEARIVGALRANGQTHTATLPWQAVPPGATLEGGPAGLVAPTVVSSDAGPVKVYNAGPTGLFDSFVAWRVPPESAMVGAARISTGPSSGINTDTFVHTGGLQDYVVPAGVTQVNVDVRGAQGGSLYSSEGGKGGRVSCRVAVIPGETLTVLVGGRGKYRAGGYGGGGNGGQGAALFTGGAGGGGMSRISRNAASLAIAGGGGGVGSHASPAIGATAGGGGYNGTAGRITKSGRGGSQTVGGAAGKTDFTVGFAGSSLQGGDGDTYTADNGLGGGGGGGGLFGGGGGAGWVTYKYESFVQRAGSGGGGSSLGSGSFESFVTAYQSGDGEVLIAPVLDQLPVHLSTCTGLMSDGSPFGWQLDNGMVRVTPVYLANAFQIDVRGWDGSEWSDPVRWQLIDSGATSSPSPAATTITGMNVVHNEPERCSIVVSTVTGAQSESVTATLTLRRGSTLCDVAFRSTVQKLYGFTRTTEDRVGSLLSFDNGGGGAIVEDDTGDGSSRWMMATSSSGSLRVVSSAGLYRISSPVSEMTVGVGFITPPADPVAVNSRWFSATSSTVRAVSR